MIVTQLYRFALYVGIAAILCVYSPALTISYLAIIAFGEIGVVVFSGGKAQESSSEQVKNEGDIKSEVEPKDDAGKGNEKASNKNENQELRKTESVYRLEWQDDDDNGPPMETEESNGKTQPPVTASDLQTALKRIQDVQLFIYGDSKVTQVPSSCEDLNACLDNLIQDVGYNPSTDLSTLSLSEKLDALEVFIGNPRSS